MNLVEKMLKFIDEDEREIFDNRIGLRTDGEYKNANGTPLNWINYNFYHKQLSSCC